MVACARTRKCLEDCTSLTKIAARPSTDNGYESCLTRRLGLPAEIEILALLSQVLAVKSSDPEASAA